MRDWKEEIRELERMKNPYSAMHVTPARVTTEVQVTIT